MRVDDIINKVFSRSFMGYDIEQVDVFLDEVIEALERCESEKQEMLTAMEYLLNKLEKSQKLPIADMKKAIDSGKPQKKRERSREVEPVEESKSAARSISRGGSGNASKPIRAPKVNRVKPEQDIQAQIIQEAQTAQIELSPEETAKRARQIARAAENWLDELLINISEHESLDYDKPLKGATVKPAESANTPDPVNTPDPTNTPKVVVSEPAQTEPTPATDAESKPTE